MAKVKLPSWLLEVAGSLEKMDLTFRRFRGRQILETLPAPSYTRSEKQDQQRNKFTQAVKEWHSMTEEEKEAYREIARELGITPYNAFLREKLRAEKPEIWYRITIDNTGSALTDYQILLKIENDPQFFDDCESKKEAIRVYDTDKATELSYWIEEWDTTNNNAKIWIKVPSIPGSSTKTIYISVDPSRTTDESDGDATFLFFDDFEDGTAGESLSSTKWAHLRGTWKYYQDGDRMVARYEGGASDGSARAINSESISETNFAVEALVKGFSGKDAGVFICSSDDVTTKYGDNYWICWGDGGTKARIFKSADTSAPLLAETTNSVPTDYTRMTVTHKSNGEIKFYREDTELVSATDTTYTSGRVGLYSWYSDTNNPYFDWIFVRKYADPEPTISYEKE